LEPLLKKIQIIVVAALVIVITILHYSTAGHQTYYHILYRELYFFPLIMAGTWFGVRGALGTSLTISLLYLPHILMHWQRNFPEDFGNVLEVLIFNAVAAVLGIMTDRKKVEQKRLLEAENLAAIGRAISCIGHDMKTPLIAIGGFARQIQKKIHKDDPCQSKLDVILREAVRLETMVKDLQEFSRPLELQQKVANFNLLVAESLSLVEVVAQQAQIKLVTQLSSELPVDLRFDPVRMEQVLINLIINAIQASPTGETVQVLTELKKEEVVLSVRDHGPGIPPGKIDFLCKPFFTTKKDGTGLGLSIVHKIIEAHQGHLEIQNNPHGGSTFKVRIPVT
jgi:two-component system sensor histidine kinase HydH